MKAPYATPCVSLFALLIGSRSQCAEITTVIIEGNSTAAVSEVALLQEGSQHSECWWLLSQVLPHPSGLSVLLLALGCAEFY